MIGQTLKHYRIEELLGMGGMGVVYRARDTRLQRPVALKLLKPELVADPERKSRFMVEARSAAAVTHPAIASIYDVDEANGAMFIAMEYIEGKTVGRLIAEGELDLQGAVEIGHQIAEGLGRAHEAESSTGISSPTTSWSPGTDMRSFLISGSPSFSIRALLKRNSLRRSAAP